MCMGQHKHILIYKCLDALGGDLRRLMQTTDTSIYLAVSHQDILRIVRTAPIDLAALDAADIDQATLARLIDDFDKKLILIDANPSNSSFRRIGDNTPSFDLMQTIMNHIQQGV